MIFGGPDNSFGGVGEVAAGKIGWRIWILTQRDVIEKFEIELLHGETDAVNYMRGAADPDAAVGLEDTLAGAEPFAIEFVICFGALRFVPRALYVDADHFSGVVWQVMQAPLERK